MFLALTILVSFKMCLHYFVCSNFVFLSIFQSRKILQIKIFQSKFKFDPSSFASSSMLWLRGSLSVACCSKTDIYHYSELCDWLFDVLTFVGECMLRATLAGSNQSIMSVEFDSEVRMYVCSSRWPSGLDVQSNSWGVLDKLLEYFWI